MLVLGAVLGLHLLFTRSLTGKAMLASAISRRAAWLVGWRGSGGAGSLFRREFFVQ